MPITPKYPHPITTNAMKQESKSKSEKGLKQPDAKPVLAAGVVLFDGDNFVRIQSANYIEDGWYIDVIGNQITLWEIPYGGGNPIKIGDFLTVGGAIHAAGRLT